MTLHRSRAICVHSCHCIVRLCFFVNVMLGGDKDRKRGYIVEEREIVRIIALALGSKITKKALFALM